MSKASEWAKTMQAVRADRDARERERPNPIYLKLGPGRSITVTVGPDGEPTIESPMLYREELEPAALCDFARQLLATFGDEATS